MPCITKQFPLSGVFIGNGMKTSITAPVDGYYAVSLYLGASLDSDISLTKMYVYVNGQQVFDTYVTPNTPVYAKLGNLQQGDTITVALSIYGVIVLATVTVKLGYIAEGEEYCYYASYFNLPVLSGLKGAVCITPNRSINIYEGCVEITGVPCIDCPLPPKTIPLQGQLQPGINYITIKAVGPLSGTVISQLEQVFSPGAKYDGVTVLNTTVKGDTVTIEVNVAETQASALSDPYVILAIAALILAIALAVTILYVTVKETKVVSVGVTVGLALLLGGAGIGIAAAVYDRLKKH